MQDLQKLVTDNSQDSIKQKKKLRYMLRALSGEKVNYPIDKYITKTVSWTERDSEGNTVCNT